MWEGYSGRTLATMGFMVRDRQFPDCQMGSQSVFKRKLWVLGTTRSEVPRCLGSQTRVRMGGCAVRSKI